MTQTTISWLTSSITTLFVALFGAFIGAILALWKSKKEKIWQEKYNAYQEILGSIYDMKHWTSETYSSCLCLPTIGGYNDKDFYQRYAEARICISRYINIGKLIISDNVSKELDEINQLLWDEDFKFEDQGIDDSNFHDELCKHAERIEKIIDDKLNEIINLAKRDLR